ncbi:MAG TPA: NAD(P)H-binding protein [Chitinophagaceae bacterium]
MNGLTAIVIGATGLTGTQLVQLLLKDDRFTTVKIFGRRPVGVQHPKLKEHIINFDLPEQWKQLVTGDVLFSALGTTIRNAGSKAAQYKIDHTYQFQVAKAAASNGVGVYVLVSSAMANTRSRIFYTRMKGELERDVKELPFQYIHIMQPGMLAGNRKEQRLGERVGLLALRFLNRLGIAPDQKPVDVKILAQAMINVSFKKEKRWNVYALLEVFRQAM